VYSNHQLLPNELFMIDLVQVQSQLSFDTLRLASATAFPLYP